ncbi:MAG TPA: alpha/beta hydrolase [Bacteroidota bacterium]|nr:alpha/beta hydrolase [Bacteroidota bacterium]
MQPIRYERQILLAVLTLLILSASSFCQPKTIRVWEGSIPGAIEDPSYKSETIYIDGNKPRITKVTDPTLDFYPAPADKATGVAIVICPGGGYGRLAIDHEGTLVAVWLNTIGISAFVLTYRLPSDAIMVNKSIGPLQDGQEAIRIVRRHAKEWNIDPHKIGIMGFSAGGHLAAMVSTHFADTVYQHSNTTSARPDFSVLVYPVISMDSTITHRGSRDNLLGPAPSNETVRYFSADRSVSKETPPAFIVQAADDKTVPVQNSIAYFLALEKIGIPCELHIYESGGHGFGLGGGTGTKSTWPQAFKAWLQARGIL